MGSPPHTEGARGKESRRTPSTEQPPADSSEPSPVRCRLLSSLGKRLIKPMMSSGTLAVRLTRLLPARTGEPPRRVRSQERSLRETPCHHRRTSALRVSKRCLTSAVMGPIGYETNVWLWALALRYSAKYFCVLGITAVQLDADLAEPNAFCEGQVTESTRLTAVPSAVSPAVSEKTRVSLIARHVGSCCQHGCNAEGPSWPDRRNPAEGTSTRLLPRGTRAPTTSLTFKKCGVKWLPCECFLS